MPRRWNTSRGNLGGRFIDRRLLFAFSSFMSECLTFFLLPCSYQMYVVMNSIRSWYAGGGRGLVLQVPNALGHWGEGDWGGDGEEEEEEEGGEGEEGEGEGEEEEGEGGEEEEEEEEGERGEGDRRRK